MKFNLSKFRFEDEPKSEVHTDVMEVVEKGYPKIVQDIHQEFMTAGDRLLKTANDILENLKIKDKEKVDALKAFGFHRTQQVTSVIETEKKIKEQSKIAEAVSQFRVEYPNYKYITSDIAEKICQKYNLVLGSVALYKGFVPQKNLDDIASFMQAYPDDNFVYVYRSWVGGSRAEVVSEADFKIKKDTVVHMGSETQCTFKDIYRKESAPLAICAPIKDMDTTNKVLIGVKLIDKPIPDPVVLLPKNHKNGIEGYLILTAWGDEASDPMVVNEQMN